MWSTPFNKTLVVVPSANAKQQGGKLGDTLLPKSTPIPKPAQEEGEMSGSDLLNFFRKIFILAHGGIKRLQWVTDLNMLVSYLNPNSNLHYHG
ncbi:hypothetical protein AAZX31_03G239300 [Glycine max]|uniref:Uncharacterized protein n=1 Tax=Glycine max TaxID=3847 RepID=K7KH53_SOYBN|nr:hypothetical protein JHK85_008822 [Glycine max]KAG5073376.1 hypothetical protein JHK86_008587 [Glycine max]KAH1071897.1 hypothetical protein GYH30_008409 [Glycine max]KAH1259610.1 hypothetical protein GmHk_03G009032 [Glycine max]KRH68954.1 hypothetical protein GLYMA_03G260400v4 [Glycine max]